MKTTYLPDFLGLGSVKCGTTWVFKVLSQHPEVFLHSAKELHFFADFNSHISVESYAKNFVGIDKTRVKAIGDISSDYFHSISAPQRVAEVIPDAKLFICVRNPIDQVNSYYWHLIRQNFNLWQNSRIPTSLEEAIDKHEHHLLHPSLYYSHLQRWLTYFDRSQVKIIFFDDIIESPLVVIKDLFSFLNVSCDFEPELLARSSSTREGVSPKNPVLYEIYKEVYSLANKKLYMPLKKVIGTENDSSLKELIQVRSFFEKVFFKKGYPKLKNNTKSYLKEYYRTEVENLSQFTERDLSHWLL